MINNKTLEDAVEVLINELKGSEEYKNYEDYRQKVRSNPILSDQIKRTREIRAELGSMNERDRNSDRAERLEEEYDGLMDITALHEFSLAELDFCGLYQEVLGKIVDSFDIDLQNR